MRDRTRANGEVTRAPSANGGNGRDSAGRFAKGNSGGPGNPYAARVARLRSAMLDAVTDEDFTAIVRKLVELAKGGDMAAIREVMTRTVGKHVEAFVVGLAEQEEDAALIGTIVWSTRPQENES